MHCYVANTKELNGEIVVIFHDSQKNGKKNRNNFSVMFTGTKNLLQQLVARGPGRFILTDFAAQGYSLNAICLN